MSEDVTLALAGDVMLGRLVNQVLGLDGYHYVWGDTPNLLRKADLRLINLECVISDKGSEWTSTPKAFHFRADPAAINTLKAAGIDFTSNANNHSLDFQEEALIDMLQLLDGNGIAHAGAGRNLTEASRPALLRSKGVEVGVVAFADYPPEWAAAEDDAGINYTPVEIGGENLSSIEKSVRATREAGADYVVFSIHWGPNMREFPSEEFKEFAHAVMDMGVDVFYGHSSHVFQGVEIYGDRPIFYDTGDFVDDYMVDPTLRNDQSFLYQVTLRSGGIGEVRLVPVVISNLQVNLAKGDLSDEVCSKMLHRSRDFATKFGKEGDHLTVQTA